MSIESVKISETPSKFVFGAGGALQLFLFLKPNMADSSTAEKNISKQLGDLFIIVTCWQLCDLEAISGWLKLKKSSGFQLIIL